jgi:hypothetical protein
MSPRIAKKFQRPLAGIRILLDASNSRIGEAKFMIQRGGNDDSSLLNPLRVLLASFENLMLAASATDGQFGSARPPRTGQDSDPHNDLTPFSSDRFVLSHLFDLPRIIAR